MGSQPKPTALRRLSYPLTYVVECFEGMVSEVEVELRRRPDIRIVNKSEGELTIVFPGSPAALSGLRLATAVYQLIPFDLPRPKALLGHQHFERLVGEIQTLTGRYPAGTFQTMRLSAAGRESAVFQRLIGALAGRLQLTPDDQAGDLFLRVRRGKTGWEVLVRLTPRPLATRAWRSADMPGALAGPLAALMIDLAQLELGDRFFNLMCGSGTLLVEQGLTGFEPSLRLGGDLHGEALAAARINLSTAAVTAGLVLMDGARLPLADRSIDVVVADLPWGQLVGSSRSNETLYPQLLEEAARVTRAGGRFVVITHDIRRFEGLLAGQDQVWRQERVIMLKIGRLRPRIYRLIRLA